MLSQLAIKIRYSILRTTVIKIELANLNTVYIYFCPRYYFNLFCVENNFKLCRDFDLSYLLYIVTLVNVDCLSEKTQTCYTKL